MENFNQLCVMQGTTLGSFTIEGFEDFFKKQGFRIKFAEETQTTVRLENNELRKDLLFYIHDNDITKFATWRFRYGIRWWEDVIHYNNNADEYTQTTLEKYPVTW